MWTHTSPFPNWTDCTQNRRFPESVIESILAVSLPTSGAIPQPNTCRVSHLLTNWSLLSAMPSNGLFDKFWNIIVFPPLEVWAPSQGSRFMTVPSPYLEEQNTELLAHFRASLLPLLSAVRWAVWLHPLELRALTVAAPASQTRLCQEVASDFNNITPLSGFPGWNMFLQSSSSLICSRIRFIVSWRMLPLYPQLSSCLLNVFT